MAFPWVPMELSIPGGTNIGLVHNVQPRTVQQNLGIPGADPPFMHCNSITPFAKVPGNKNRGQQIPSVVADSSSFDYYFINLLKRTDLPGHRKSQDSRWWPTAEKNRKYHLVTVSHLCPPPEARMSHCVFGAL
jgi:hypothetical protein